MRLADQTNASLKINDIVEVRYRGGKKYFPGKIKAIRANGTYDIRYDDNDEEKKVKREMIRKKNLQKIVVWSTGT